MGRNSTSIREGLFSLMRPALPQIWRAKAGVAGEGVGCASAFPTAITRPSRWSPVCVSGLVAQKAFDKPMNAATFEEWVEKCLVPTLSKGDIVVMDNLSSHKGPRVEQLIEAAGAELRYLPPYSPNLRDHHCVRPRRWIEARDRRAAAEEALEEIQRSSPPRIWSSSRSTRAPPVSAPPPRRSAWLRNHCFRCAVSSMTD